jgi:DNA replication initiation complex subunit (GINS family)
MDLFKIRTVKLLPLTVGEDTPEIMQKVTLEEQTLFNEVRNIVQKWKNTVLEEIEDE